MALTRLWPFPRHAWAAANKENPCWIKGQERKEHERLKQTTAPREKTARQIIRETKLNR